MEPTVTSLITGALWLWMCYLAGVVKRLHDRVTSVETRHAQQETDDLQWRTPPDLIYCKLAKLLPIEEIHTLIPTRIAGRWYIWDTANLQVVSRCSGDTPAEAWALALLELTPPVQGST